MRITKNLAAKFLKDLPADPQLRLMAWNELQELLKDLKKVESTLRKEMLSEFFPSPEEGTNNCALGNDWKAVCKQPVTRKCDEAAFEPVFKQLPRGYRQKLIKTSHTLIVANYRKLSEDERKIFDEALIISNGSASLTVVPPKA